MSQQQNEKVNNIIKNQTEKKQSDARNDYCNYNCKQKKYCFRTLAWDDPDNTLSYKLCFGPST